MLTALTFNAVHSGPITMLFSKAHKLVGSKTWSEVQSSLIYRILWGTETDAIIREYRDSVRIVSAPFHCNYSLFCNSVVLWTTIWFVEHNTSNVRNSFERVLTECARSTEQLDSFNQKSRLLWTQNLCGSHRAFAISDFVFVLLFNLHSVLELTKKR